MKNFLDNEKKIFLQFITESKLFLSVTIFFVILSYGIKLFYFDFSIDTEAILNDYQKQMSGWETLDRLGLVFTKFLFFHNNRFNPFVANFLTYFTFILTCLLLCYLVQRILNIHAKKVAIIIIPILFLTHPIFAEQFNFILQSFEVSLAILFLVIALVFSYYYISTNYKVFAFLSILLCTWSFLTYQSLLLFFIAGAIASFILILYVQEKEKQVENIRKYLFIVIKYFFIFFTSYVLSQQLVIIHAKLTGIQRSSYLTNQILWGKLPYTEVIRIILEQIKSIVFAKFIYFNYSFLFSAIIVIVILILKLLKKNKSVYFEIIGFILLYLSPFLLTIFIGRGEVFRAQMPAIQFVIAFSFYYIYLHLKNNLFQKLFVSLCLIIAFNQSNVTANLLFSEHAKYEEDVTFANRINFQLDSMGVGNRSNYSLVIIGKHEPESVLNIQVETLGHSFFAWDVDTKYGTSNRAIGFMRTLGYMFKEPTLKQLNYAHSIENKMTVWPNKDSILIIGNLIIIKLSD